MKFAFGENMLNMHAKRRDQIRVWLDLTVT